MGTALITGATSGLGLEFAWQLATAGHHVVLVARNQSRLDAVAGQIRSATGVDVEVYAADLSQPDDVARVAERLSVAAAQLGLGGETRRPVGLLVNNAGFGTGQPFISGRLDTEVAMVDVMVRAVV
ncbi:MAG: SDR family NAD(P)-dependent oxidoreductase, partial [Cellulomonadaceae bacterium]|nr:SDR family NAD(P)-dependent oxidoreductase [Cellulomonadaceae bacterium]